MVRPRAALAAVALGCSVLAVPVAPAAAAAEPASVVSVDSEVGDPVGAGQTTVYKSPATVSAVAVGAGWHFTVRSGTTQPWTATIAPPADGTLSGGQAYTTATSAGPGVAGLDVRISGRSCSTSTGTLLVRDVVVDPAGALTSFAADYRQQCDGSVRSLFGAVRFHSATGVSAARFTATGANLGNVAVGSSTAPRTVTVTSIGTEAVPLTSATLAGDAAGDYAITRDDCSGALLPAGQTCLITVSAAPTQRGVRSASLVLLDGSHRGTRTFALSATGVEPPSEPLHVSATAAADGIRVTWSAPAYTGSPTSGVSEYEVLRGRTPDELTLLATRSHAVREYADKLGEGTVAGTTYFYAVRAKNMAGVGATSTAVSATAPAEPVAPGGASVLTVDGAPGAFVADGRSRTFVDGQGTSRVLLNPRHNGFSMYGDDPAGSYIVVLASSSGRFTPGRYATRRAPEGEHLGLDVSGDGRGCNASIGTVDISTVTYSADGSLLSFAAEYELHCESALAPPVHGVLRWHSDAPFTAAELDGADVGVVQIGTARPVLLRYRNTGSVPVTVDGVTLAGEDWALTDDGCSGTVPAGGSCELTATVTPTVHGARPATLSLRDSTATGHRERVLTAVGSTAPPAPVVLEARTGEAGIALGWSARDQPEAGNRSIRVYRGTTADDLTLVATLDGWVSSWTDDRPDGTYYYALSAVNAIGEGPRSPARRVDLALAAPAAVEVGASVGHAVVQWSPPPSLGRTPFAGYRVYRGASAAALTAVAATPSTTRTFEAPLAAGTTAWFAVAAHDATGREVRSAPVPVTAVWSQLVFATDTADGTGSLHAAAASGPARVLEQVPYGAFGDLAVSPDGRRLAYVRDSAHGAGVWVRPLTGPGTPVAVAPATAVLDFFAPAWSPDGRTLVLTAEDHAAEKTWLVRVPATGGSVQPLAGGTDLAYASWLPDGSAVIAADLTTDEAPLVRLGITGTAAGTRTAVAGSERGTAPAVRPGGREVAFLAALDDGTTALKVSSLASTATRTLTTPARTHATSAAWTPDGSRLEIAVDSAQPRLAGDLWSLRADGTDLRRTRATAEAYESSVVRHVEDVTAPAPTLTAPAAVTLATTATVAYGAQDRGVGVASYDVRYRRSAWNGTFGPFASPAGWLATTATSRSVVLPGGTEACFSVRARDWYGNTSGWSPERCTSVPLDDTAFARSSGWGRVDAGGYYASTFSTTTSAGTTLTRTGVQGRRFALVALRCPTCGKVDVYVAGRRIAAGVSLYAPTSQRQVVLPLPLQTTVLSGTVAIRSTMRGKTVRIDGFSVRRT